MLTCWATNPKERPTFGKIISMLECIAGKCQQLNVFGVLSADAPCILSFLKSGTFNPSGVFLFQKKTTMWWWKNSSNEDQPQWRESFSSQDPFLDACMLYWFAKKRLIQNNTTDRFSAPIVWKLPTKLKLRHQNTNYLHSNWYFEKKKINFTGFVLRMMSSVQQIPNRKKWTLSILQFLHLFSLELDPWPWCQVVWWLTNKGFLVRPLQHLHLEPLPQIRIPASKKGAETCMTEKPVIDLLIFLY